jgi:hypothetical protein
MHFAALAAKFGVLIFVFPELPLLRIYDGSKIETLAQYHRLGFLLLPD